MELVATARSYRLTSGLLGSLVRMWKKTALQHIIYRTPVNLLLLPHWLDLWLVRHALKGCLPLGGSTKHGSMLQNLHDVLLSSKLN